MIETGFVLDARLQADTHFVTSLSLCDVLLMNDARFPWLVLVPRRDSLAEVSDLAYDEQQSLWQEVQYAATALRHTASFEKLNIGALGNIVRQLHVHVVGRKEGDAAWPGPVWGHGDAEGYTPSALAQHIASLRQPLEEQERTFKPSK